jgi:hypothetical protein
VAAKKAAQVRKNPGKVVEIPEESGNFAAACRTIAYLRRQGWLGPEDDALVEMVLSLAHEVDKNPEAALLWKQYSTAEAQLRRKVKDNDDDTLGELLRELSAPVRDTSNRKS